jgi:guanosine-3',5'-bis(diphosphate) 3'-pyrophosphohydrolase
MQKIILAANFAANKHRDQRRKDREASPYINHPLALAFVLTNEVTGITDENVIAAAILHDTIEDTDTTTTEISNLFGEAVLRIVLELTDDKNLPKETRKQLQIDNASKLSREAKLVKLADKICNVRDMANSPPINWSLERQLEYFDWTKAVIDGLRGTHTELEVLFDHAYSLKPMAT